MRPFLPAAALALTLAAAQPSAGQPAAVRVERTGAPRVQASPGQRVTAVFRVSRRSAADRIRLTPALPAGWSGLSTAPPSASASFVHLVPFSVPGDARAGRYVVRLAAEAAGVRAADSLVVVVPEVRSVTLTVTGSPRFAAAGSSYQVTARLANRGNAPVRVRVIGEGQRGFTPSVSSPEVALAPRASADVRVTVSTPARLDQARLSLVQLRADVVGDSAHAEAVSRVQVVPRGRGAPLQQLPVTVGMRAAGGGGGVPATLSASGPIGPDGRAHLDLRYRGAGAAAPELGEREEIYLFLRTPGLQLRAGDQFWSLSPLTEPGAPGRGVGVRAGGDRFSAAAFVQRNHRQPGAATMAAARVQAAAGGLSAHLNGMRRGADSVAVSAGFGLRPLRGVSVQGEYALGAGAAAGSRGVDGRVSAAGARAGVQARALRTDAGFPGLQGGRRAVSASAFLRPLDGLRLYGSWEDEARIRPEIVHDTATDLPHPYLPEHTDRSRFLRGGVDLRGLSITYQDGSWANGGQEGGERRSRSLSGSVRARRGPVSLSTGLEGGYLAAAGEEVPFSRAWVRSGLALPGAAYASGSVERYVAGGAVPGAASRTAGTLQLGAALGRSTSVALTSQAALADDGRISAGFVDASIEQRVRSYTLSLRTRRALGGGERGWTTWLDIELPLRITTSHRPAPGSVLGRVVDAGGRGVPNALVRAGGRLALTDGRGNWSIGGLEPGRHVVEVDPLSAGLGTLPAQRDAVEVDLSERGARVDVELTRSARLAGSLTRFVQPPFGEGGDPRPAGGVVSAVVELRRGDERVQGTTDGAGRFDLRDLRPGRWVLRVVEADLPPGTSVQPDSVVLELGPGAEQETHLRAMPARRVLRIVSSGELVVGEPAPAVHGVAAAEARPGRAGEAPLPPPAATPDPAPRGRGLLGRPAPDRPTVTRVVVEVPEAEPAEVGASGFRDWVDSRYTVWPGDRSLETVAGLVYSDPALWPKLWLANREWMESPERLTPGMVLIVPPKAPLTSAERAAAAAYRLDRRRR